MAKPDERAVMTYVSCYYHALQGAHKVSSNVVVVVVIPVALPVLQLPPPWNPLPVMCVCVCALHELINLEIKVSQAFVFLFCYLEPYCCELNHHQLYDNIN